MTDLKAVPFVIELSADADGWGVVSFRGRLDQCEARLASLTTVTEEDVERVANTPEVKRHFCGSCKAYKEHEDAIRAALTAFVRK